MPLTRREFLASLPAGLLLAGCTREAPGVRKGRAEDLAGLPNLLVVFPDQWRR